MSDKNYYYSVGDFYDSVISRRKEVFTRGMDSAFNCTNELLSYKQGYSTVIYSYSHQGKTQFALEEAVHMVMAYQIHVAVYLTENGTKEEAVMDIAMIYLGKKLFGETAVSDEEYIEAIQWVKKYFFINDTQQGLLTIREIYNGVAIINKTYNVEIKLLLIDHYGNVEKDEDLKRASIADSVKTLMQTVTKGSIKLNLHSIILFHVRDKEPTLCSHSKLYYMGEPDHYDISGGQQVNYLGQQMVCVWRPINNDKQLGIINPENGMPFALNEMHIKVTKSKPKMIGKLGKTVLFFDAEKQRYYEKDFHGKRYYAGEHKQEFNPDEVVARMKARPDSGISPNTDFDTPFK